jgi:hypothetical protein
MSSMPLQVLLLTRLLFLIAILAFLSLLTRRCSCSSSVKYLLVTFYTHSKSRDDSTPNKGSSKAKNTLGYEEYNVLSIPDTLSLLPDFLPA